MNSCRNRHNVLTKIIVLVVVCLFLVNDICRAQSARHSFTNSTLAVQSIFNPIIDVVGIQHQKQVEFELSGIIAMALRGLKRDSGNLNKYTSFLNINSALDKRCANTKHTDKRFVKRTLDVVSNPSILNDRPENPIVINIKTTGIPKNQKYFRIIFKGNKLDDMLDASKIEVETVEPRTLLATDISWVGKYINKKISELPLNEEGNLIRNSWQAAINDPKNPIFRTISDLTHEGVKKHTLQRLIDILFGLGIDASNPWTASYHISDIIGYMSSELLGEDLSRFKSKIRTVSFTNIRSIEHVDVIQHHFYDHNESLTALKERYYVLREWQEKIICSKNSLQFIYSEVSSSTDAFIEQAVRTLLPLIWKELEIPLNSQAILYFRKMKSFTSDLDLFYWGPKREEVNIRLTELFFLLGIKRDLFSTYLMSNETENGNVDYDIYHYFFGGKSVEINNASFKEFYKEYIESKADTNRMWQDVYPYLCRQLAMISNEGPFTLPIDSRDFKKLLFRGVTNLLFGLSKKFNISFGTNETFLLASLSEHLEKNEICTIRETISLANQARNLYQVITKRRWEANIDDKTISKMGEIIAYQGIPDFMKKIEQLGVELERIRNKYFGPPEFRNTKYLPLYTDDRSKKAWHKTAHAYSYIVEKRSTIVKTPQRSITPSGEVEIKKPDSISILNELLLFNHISPYLGDCPVDETIDLSLIPKEDFEANMRTWAYIIALNNKHGLDINYIFKSDNEAYKIEAKKMLLNKIEEIKEIDIEKVKERVTDIYRSSAFQVHIMKKEDLEKLEDIPEGVLPVALSEGNTLDGTPLRDFMSASVIGLAQAALKKMQIENNPHLLEVAEQEILPRMQHIYQRLFPDKDIKEIVTKETILNMIDNDPIIRKNLAIALALPPIIRVAIQYLKDYNDRIHLLQQAA